MNAELFWFPFFAADWLSSPAIGRMLPEQEGAYIRLLSFAWGAGDVEPSLPDDADELAAMSRLGKRWGKLGVLVRAQFSEKDGKLYNKKLSGVWREQQHKHATASAKASAGGRASAAKRAAKVSASSSTTSSTTSTSSSSRELELEAVASAPNGAEGQQPASPAAPAPVGAARRSADSTGQGEISERKRALVEAYKARLSAKFDVWATRHPDDAAALESGERRELGLPDGELAPWQSRAVRDAVLDAFRAMPRTERIPTCEEFIADELARAS